MRPNSLLALAAAAILLAGAANPARGYVINQQIADTNDPRNAGVSGCPMPTHLNLNEPGGIDRRWDTMLGANILTTRGFPGGAEAEVQGVIQDSFAAWAGVAGSALTPSSYAPLGSTSSGNSCAATDGLNTICFAQDDSFSPGVLAFTRVVTADVIGQTLGAKTALFIGQILDADVELNPAVAFATPGALAANPAAYDLESILIHELGHTLGFAESPVVGAAMFPFAPAPGTFLGARPTPAAPDAPLADDDRAGVRVVYPGPAAYGTIRGRVLPANPLSLASLPATSSGMWVTGYYGAHVVAVDAATGDVVAGALAGWSCDPSQQITNFDGSYEIGGLPLGRSYALYAEPLTGAVAPQMLSGPLEAQPCRAGTSNACTPPAVNTLFDARIKP
jgi:matrixin